MWFYPRKIAYELEIIYARFKQYFFSGCKRLVWCELLDTAQDTVKVKQTKETTRRGISHSQTNKKALEYKQIPLENRQPRTIKYGMSLSHFYDRPAGPNNPTKINISPVTHFQSNMQESLPSLHLSIIVSLARAYSYTRDFSKKKWFQLREIYRAMNMGF